MNCSFRRSLQGAGLRAYSLLLASSLLCLPASTVAQSALSLHDGSTLLGWAPKGTWSGGGGILSTSVGTGRELTSAVPFGDFDLSFEFNESTPLLARLRIWATREDREGVTVDLDSAGAAGNGGIEGKSHLPQTALLPGWHHVTITAKNGLVSVRLDNGGGGTVSGLGTRAGYLAFEAVNSGTLQIRSLRLTPAGLTNIFNGTDLGGWKGVEHRADSKGGVGHAFEKTLTFGIGGGSTKPHLPKWSVSSGAIHGEDGPGGLQYTSGVEDAILQLTASVRGKVNTDNFAGVSLRGNADQLAGGYDVGVGPFTGSIAHLVNKPYRHEGTSVTETVIIAGRTIAIWNDGQLVTVYTDSRPESSNSSQGAKTTAGTLSLQLPKDASVNVTHFAMAELPKVYGVATQTPVATPIAVPTSTPATAASNSAGPSAAETALLNAQQQQQRQQQSQQADKQRSASLMTQALSTSDPQQQMALYGQVVQIDPTNTAAVQGYKDAKTKVESQQSAQQQQQLQQQNAQMTEESRASETNASLAKAQGAFLAGHLGDASQALSVAERLSPSNPLVRDLRQRIAGAQNLRSRLWLLGSGVGLLALVGIAAAWFRRRRMQQFPVLTVARGLDEGQQYPIEKQTVHIGAVAQDGGQKNDIVVRDVEHAISRFHCEITRRDGRLFVTDLKSSNGTRVDGKALTPGEPKPLRKGSRITLADTVDLLFGYERRPKAKSS